MNLMPLVSILVAACQAPSAVAAQDSRQAGLRVYDLRPLALRTSGDQLSDRLFPVLAAEPEDPGELSLEVNRDFPAAVLRLAFASDFEAEGTALEDLGYGRLAVRGPVTLHERLARFLPRCSQVLGARVQLELCFVRASGALPSGGLILPEAEVTSWLETSAGEGNVERLQVELGAGLPAVVDLGREVGLVADYDVEVGEGSYIFDPRVWDVLLGTRLALRAAPGDGGLFLALDLRRASEVGAVRSRMLERVCVSASENSSELRRRDVLHQSQPVLDRSLALNAFLPVGRALVVVLEHGPAGLREALLVRRVSGDLARSARIEALTLYDATGWAPPAAVGSIDEGLGGRPRLLPPSNEWSVDAWIATQEDDYPSLEDVLVNQTSVFGESFDAYESGWPWIAVPSPSGSKGSAVESLLAAFAPEQRNVQVTLTLRGARAKEPLARLALPLRAGLASLAVLGVEDLIVDEADVEIAKYCAIEDPLTRIVFDGLLMRCEPRFELDGTLVLALRGAAAGMDEALRKLALSESGAVGELESMNLRHLFVDQELRFPAGGGRARIGGESSPLWLEVELRP